MADSKTLLEQHAMAASAECFQAFNSFSKLLSGVKHDDAQGKAINESIIADLLGDAKMPNAQSLLDQAAVDLLHSFLDLSTTVNRFPTIGKMIKRHPWRSTITRSAHLEHCCHALCNECYILEERIKVFFDAIQNCAKKYDLEPLSKSMVRRLISLHKKEFGTFIAVRGQHVHQFSNVPREIRRIGLIETLMHSEDFFPEYLPGLHREAIFEARRIWGSHAARLGNLAQIFFAAALRSSRSVWEPSIERALSRIKDGYCSS